MKRKLLITGLVALLVLALTVPFAFAANPAPSTPSNNTSSVVPPATQNYYDKLTDSQKQEINNIQKQIIDLRKKLVDKYQSFGVIDKSQADFYKSRIDDMYKYMQNGGCGGFGLGPNGNGASRGNGRGFGRGMMGGF